MKISRLGNRHQKNLVFVKRTSNEEFAKQYSEKIERARAYVEKRSAQLWMAIEKSPHRFDELKVEGGILAGPLGKD